MEKMVLKGVRELADFLDISVQTAQTLTKRQDFPSGRIGKCILTPIPQLLNWLAAGGTETKENAQQMQRGKAETAWTNL